MSEQLRTFAGTLFRLDAHLARLRRSLAIVGLDDAVAVEPLESVATRLVHDNHRLLESGDDLGLTLFVTPGPYPALAPGDARHGPTVGLHTYPLPFHLWDTKFERGERLIVSQVRQVPAQCWPAELKCRSRMHYYLADREAALTERGARAVLLDLEGRVIEASTANLLLYLRDAGLISPPRDTILPGVSVAVVEELAARLEIPFRHQALTVSELKEADELLLCSTSPCVWPVVSLDGVPVGQGQPGGVFERLLTAWSEMVGVDIRQQAHRFARRGGV